MGSVFSRPLARSLITCAAVCSVNQLISRVCSVVRTAAGRDPTTTTTIAAVTAAGKPAQVGSEPDLQVANK
jgi:hypothetical protein